MLGPLEFSCCRDPNRPDFGEAGLGNIASKGIRGKRHGKTLLYRKTCGKRFAATRDSPLFGAHPPVETARQIIHLAATGVGARAAAELLGLSKNTVSSAIVKVGEHCQRLCSSLMRDLQMSEAQPDEPWAFVKKMRLLASSSSKKSKEKPGPGQPKTSSPDRQIS